jgi:hypothetical protein
MRQDIRDRLIETARAGEVIFYMELGIGRGRAAGAILEEISNHEWSAGRPLLTAVVANRSKGMPSPGFWDLPAIPSGLSERQQPIVWAREVMKVIEYWQSH